MLTNLSKANYEFIGERGLPENYPIPPLDEKSLFYIQRNLNTNTVVYEMNYLYDGSVNEEIPMHPYWIKYSNGGTKKELNYFQNKLAYGYHSQPISSKLFEFKMVSYDKLRFFISFDEADNRFNAITTINNKHAQLSNIYVYAEEFGLFPDVQYFELYGTEIESGLSTYQKIIVN